MALGLFYIKRPEVIGTITEIRVRVVRDFRRFFGGASGVTAVIALSAARV
jgi:hypothetical protein